MRYRWAKVAPLGHQTQRTLAAPTLEKMSCMCRQAATKLAGETVCARFCPRSISANQRSITGPRSDFSCTRRRPDLAS